MKCLSGPLMHSTLLASTLILSGQQAISAERKSHYPAAVPLPNEIFDFHPKGSKADSWRSPFDVSMTDGPLSAMVKKSNADLVEVRKKSETARKLQESCKDDSCISTKLRKVRAGATSDQKSQ